MQWAAAPPPPQDIWDCCDSDGLLDPVKYNDFLIEQAEYEGLKHQMFLDAMTSLLLSQCTTAYEDKKETDNKVPSKRRKKGIVHFIDSDGKRHVLPPPPPHNVAVVLVMMRTTKLCTFPSSTTNFGDASVCPTSYKELCVIAADCPLFGRWKPGRKDAVGKDSTPLNLLILASLRYLGRGWTFEDLEEATAISEEVLQVFFHVFVEFGSTVFYDKFVTSHLINCSNPATLHDFANAASRSSVRAV